MKVTVRLGGSLAGSGAGEREVIIPHGATVRAVVERPGLGIPSVHRTSGTAASPVPLILLNGRNIEFLEGLDTPLAEGDVVAIFPASEGG
jgi:molybdopterin converting factor small subunit